MTAINGEKTLLSTAYVLESGVNHWRVNQMTAKLLLIVLMEPIHWY